jgi:hypothetical protein
MSVLLVMVSLVVSTVAISLALPVIVETYARFRRPRTVTCPELNQQSTIGVAAGLAAVSCALCPTILHIKECALWPEHHKCSRQCVFQLRQVSP